MPTKCSSCDSTTDDEVLSCECCKKMVLYELSQTPGSFHQIVIKTLKNAALDGFAVSVLLHPYQLAPNSTIY